MITDFINGCIKRVLRHFPERQLYLRAHGEVKYYHLSTPLQLAVTTALTIMALWCLLTVGNVIWGYNPFSSAAQQLRQQETNFQRALAEERAKLENSRLMLTQQRESFEKIARSFEVKHSAITTMLNAAGNPSPLSEDSINIEPQLSYANDRILVSPILRDPAPRIARRDFIKTQASTTSDVDRFLINLSDSQDDILKKAELEMLDNIERKRAIIRATNVSLEDILDASPHGKGGVAAESAQTTKLENGEFLPRMDSIEARITETEILDAAMRAIPLSTPIDAEHYMTSRYGMRSDPFTKRPTFHAGQDYGGRKNTPIIATAGGVVTMAGRNGGFGKMVEVNHGHGFKTRYAHLHRINVKRGQVVTKGQLLGGMGSTGRSTSNHLHYEVHFQGRAVDPAPFLKAGQYVQ